VAGLRAERSVVPGNAGTYRVRLGAVAIQEGFAASPRRTNIAAPRAGLIGCEWSNHGAHERGLSERITRELAHGVTPFGGHLGGRIGGDEDDSEAIGGRGGMVVIARVLLLSCLSAVAAPSRDRHTEVRERSARSIRCGAEAHRRMIEGCLSQMVVVGRARAPRHSPRGGQDVKGRSGARTASFNRGWHVPDDLLDASSGESPCPLTSSRRSEIVGIPKCRRSRSQRREPWKDAAVAA
jgi:hypothetical protein